MEGMERKLPRPFRFEATWLDDENYVEVVRNSWANPGSQWKVSGVMGKIKRCCDDLREWDKMTFGNVLRDLQRVRDELRALNKSGFNGSMVKYRNFLEEERTLMGREEILWNTSYFHQKASGRIKCNRIVKLVDDSGKLKVTLDYFAGLFQSDDRTSLEAACFAMDSLLTPSDNDVLLAEFTVEEVRQAVFSIHPTK
ncbi:hypothetical protein V2J09_001368 [Rumex salicifolius]